METVPTWRELLLEAIRTQEQRQRVAATLGVHPVTLTRWAARISQPRLEKLRLLPDVLPSFREPLVASLQEEYPGLLSRGMPSLPLMKAEIPSAFYHRVLTTYATLPAGTRQWSISMLILQQMLAQLDPHRQGMGIVLAVAVAPVPGHPVRSLRQLLSKGTGPWQCAGSTRFFGAESLVGLAFMKGHLLVLDEDEISMLTRHSEDVAAVRHAVAIPIVRSGQVAGSLCVWSAQPSSASLDVVGLLEAYAALFPLAFGEEAWHALERINLGVIPTPEHQQAVLHQFGQRVLACIVQARRAQREFSLMQAEEQVWRQMEAELLVVADASVVFPLKEKERRSSWPLQIHGS